jgi:DNA-binding IclR family transcriptional regulator
VPGPGIHVLAAMSLRGSHLLEAAAEPIERLADRTGGGVALGVLWRRHVCYLFHGRPDEAPLAAVAGHNLYPAEQSSNGKVLLAEEPDMAVRRRFDDTDVDVDALLAELETVRRRGYAVNRAQSLAVKVGEPPVAALAVIKDITPENRDELLHAVKDAAAQIVSELRN